MQIKAQGKFFFANNEKFYLKAIHVAGPHENYSNVLNIEANTVWLARPTIARINFFARMGLKVVVQLEFNKCMQFLFAGEKSAYEIWLKNTAHLLNDITDNPAVIAYDLGAPIDESVFRWLGEKKIRQYIKNAFSAVKKLDPNRPLTCTTDSRSSLALAFLDFYSRNVLELAGSDFRTQMSALQTQAGDRPLVVHSVGVDSADEGGENQGVELVQQVNMAFIAGVVGFGLMSWRDSFSDSRKFGVLNVDGTRKPSFSWFANAFRESPFPEFVSYPKISIVICIYNGERDIEECLDGVSRLNYPNFEAIIVNDGSTDKTESLAKAKCEAYGFNLISYSPNRGLSAARNVGMEAATGEIIAYLDSDAFPDPDWLRYLGTSFLSTKHAIIGGPNINPLSAGPIVDCINSAPGNPAIVMSRDELADHIPGCNLAVRRGFMKAVGGFDERYVGGGDDVHFCWKVNKFGGTMGASPGAVVWHYRRPTLRTYLKQQFGYGKGEAALEKDWPERFNSLGHQVGPKSGPGLNAPLNTGTTSACQPRIYQAASVISTFTSMPEWPMFIGVFIFLSLLGFLWNEFFVFLPFAVAGLALWIAQALRGAVRAQLRYPSLRSRMIVGYLFLAQPIVRVYGRLASGMTPWRSRCHDGFVNPQPKIIRIAAADAAETLAKLMRQRPLPAVKGSSLVAWDWQIEGGIFGGVRALGNSDGLQTVFRVWPVFGRITYLLAAITGAAFIVAIVAQALLPLLLFLSLAVILVVRALRQCGEAMATLQPLLQQVGLRHASLWERFQPPRHFFEQPALPKNDTVGAS